MVSPGKECRDLALAISSCGDVCSAFGNSNHPCRKIVEWQAKEWIPPVLKIEGSRMHRPEAWTGNLELAPIIFLSSNPSFDMNENFPSWNPDSWSDSDIIAFGAERFTRDTDRKFGATDSGQRPFQDRTIGLTGEPSPLQVKHWTWVRHYVSLVLDKSVEETSAIDDYVMTELVHCKSPKEKGVLEALEHCSNKWFEEIMRLSPAKLIFVAGAKAGEAFARTYRTQVPDDWGRWSKSRAGKGKGSWPRSEKELNQMMSDGQWSLETQMRNSVDIEIGGRKRIAVYISRPGGGPICAPWSHPDLLHSGLLEYWRSKFDSR